MHTTDITSREEIEELMQPGGAAALIDFWAAWCGPCRAMAPHFEKAAELMADEPVEFLKVDTEKHSQIASAFNVRSLPTIVVVHDGEIQDVMIGAQDTLTLKRAAQRVIDDAEGRGFIKKLFG